MPIVYVLCGVPAGRRRSGTSIIASKTSVRRYAAAIKQRNRLLFDLGYGFGH